MAREGAINCLTESQVISYVVYVMAKMGYSRKNIAEVVQELNHTFDIKSDDFIYKASLIVGQEDRKKLLPTIRSDKDNNSSNKVT
ncbi:hypothetical protein ACFO25_02050 [Paenactinomyces guangxiensis]|uniref:Uncharacterized protein n=1 Tax=Paenactinomyces guangxiensis TaxID=1490290 RepID=A0A7W1WS08_9BACL|nr:hypothetical protein [Paenactinomyces guangxiensis]MBA4495012.1 hypothetical protein [Paenactinomyces guangxiensis]MBH8592095.1 hypothetical protein [Paenactinomyces guangxiensis]